MVAIILYVDDIVMLSKSKSCLQRLMNKLDKLRASYDLEVNVSKINVSTMTLELASPYEGLMGNAPKWDLQWIIFKKIIN